jgi:hypothetical protein
MILMASWEIALGASVIAIFNGGVAGLVYMYIVCWIGFLAVYSSMAEMGTSITRKTRGATNTAMSTMLQR